MMIYHVGLVAWGLGKKNGADKSIFKVTLKLMGKAERSIISHEDDNSDNNFENDLSDRKEE